MTRLNAKQEAQTAPALLSEEMTELIDGMDWAAADRQAAAQEAVRIEREAIAVESRRRAAAKALWNLRGKRYERCTLENYRATSKQQVEVRDGVAAYMAEIRERISGGVNVVLLGPPGTGKDHLLAVLMRAALETNKTVAWVSGAMLQRRFRDSITEAVSEHGFIRRYTELDVLAISDPAWEHIPLTDYQRNRLGEIIDCRYNDLRPTWVTLNARDRREANVLLGAALVDRLRDGALSLACNWESYRG